MGKAGCCLGLAECLGRNEGLLGVKRPFCGEPNPISRRLFSHCVGFLVLTCPFSTSLPMVMFIGDAPCSLS